MNSSVNIFLLNHFTTCYILLTVIILKSKLLHMKVNSQRQLWKIGFSKSSPGSICMHTKFSVMPDYLRPCGLQQVNLLCPQDSPGKNSGVGCHTLLQAIFPTQESNPHLLCVLPWHTHTYMQYPSPITDVFSKSLKYFSAYIISLD